MDKIWDRKSFEVGGHWPLCGDEKKRMTTQNRQKSNAIFFIFFKTFRGPFICTIKLHWVYCVERSVITMTVDSVTMFSNTVVDV